MDVALVEKCADSSLTAAIVEQFVVAVGSDDPLAITVKADGRLVLIPKPRSADEALAVVRNYVGHAVIRVGLTQFPVGIGVADASQLQPSMFDACENVRTGTAMFAKVARIVTKWYGRPINKELLPQMLDDAIYAWKMGNFEGNSVFTAEDPGGPTFFGATPEKPNQAATPTPEPVSEGAIQPSDPEKAADAGIRIDLSRIGGQN